MARPEVPIDWKRVDELIQKQCTAEEIAGYFNLSTNRFYERVSDKYNKNFTDYRLSIQSKGRGILREKQWDKAIEGNVQLLLKLGEIYLDQKDKSEIDTKITIEHNYATSDGSP